MSRIDPRMADAATVVAHVNEAHGLGLTLAGPLAGVQSGAWLVTDLRGSRAVLKWTRAFGAERLIALQAIVERLRAAGYPTPAWLAVGVTAAGEGYHLQEFVTGEPATPLTPVRAGLLLDVLDSHVGLDPDPHTDRSAEIAIAATDESPAGLRHAARRLGPPSEAVIAHFDRVTDSFGDVHLPCGDLVHGDFNSCNILLAHGRVSAVIDIEGLGSGSRVIDLACLLREAYIQHYGDTVKRMIRDRAEDVAGPGVLAVAAAAAAFFIVSFKARYQPDLLSSTLADLHLLADDLMPTG